MKYLVRNVQNYQMGRNVQLGRMVQEFWAETSFSGAEKSSWAETSSNSVLERVVRGTRRTITLQDVRYLRAEWGGRMICALTLVPTRATSAVEQEFQMEMYML